MSEGNNNQNEQDRSIVNEENSKNSADKAAENAEAIKEGIKSGVSLAKNAASGNVVGAVKDAVNLLKNKQVRRKLIIAAITPIIIVILLAGALLSIFGAVADTVQEVIGGVAGAIVDFFTVDDDGAIVVADEQIDEIINSIEELGVSVQDLKLLGDYDENATEEEKQAALRKYIRQFYEAQAVTETLNYYHQESTDTKTYGAVYVYRTNEGDMDGTNRRPLTYITYEEMLAKQAAGDETAKDYFTIDDSGNLVIAGTTQVIVETGSNSGSLSEQSNTITVNLRNINYKSAISQYTTKMNFLIYLTMISQNPEFVSALVDLIKDSRIEITIMDNVSTYVSTETYNYTLNTKSEVTGTDVNTGQPYSYYVTNSSNQTEITKTTTISTNPSANINYVKTWFCEQTISYGKNIDGPVETANNTTQLGNESAPAGAGSWKTNQSINVREENTTESYAEVSRGDVKIILGKQGDGERYANGEIEEPTFIGLMETEYRIPYSSRTEAAGTNLVSGAEMLFYLLQKDSELENMETIMRYALYLYSGRDFGVTELDGENFSITGFATAGGGVWSAIWDDSVTREEFVELVEAFTPPNGTGNSGRSYRECYNKYFVANAENFYDICTKNGIDPRFVFSIGVHESAYGTSDIANSKGNFFGWAAYDSSPGESASTFYDMSDGIETVSSGLRNYTTPGTWQYQAIQANGYDPTTIDGIGSLYASDPNWANAVKNYMTTIFGCTGIGASNGDIVSAAVNVHSYLRNNGYMYAQRGITVPNTSGRTIDCSSYVTWVLVEAGVPGFTNGMYQWTSSTFGSNPKGWQTVSADDAAPGDIVVYPGHVEIIAENTPGNYFTVYNCGSNSAIMASGTSELPESSRGSYSKGQATVILRVPTN